jgi:ribulose-5-phosphate 4-epimerase/fuculose-1-phosphate aldolase
MKTDQASAVSQLRPVERAPRPALSMPAPRVVRLLRDELIDISRLVYDRGLTVGISGNASIRLLDTDTVLIKATGACQGHMTADEVVLVSLDGEVLAGCRPPSRELAWHLAVYRRRRDVGAIIHAHPPYATAWAVANRIPSPPYAALHEFLGRIEMIDAAPPGSPRLASLVTKAFSSPDVSVALLRGHGIVTAGRDLRSAYYLAEHLEDMAKVALLSSAIGGGLPR